MWALLAIVALVVVVAGKRSSVDQVTTYYVGDSLAGVAPVPDAGSGFRSAPAPFGPQSGSNDAFRAEAFFGHGLNGTRTVKHEAPLADVSPSANGTLTIHLFATLQDAEQRCMAWTWLVRIEAGRAVSGLNALPPGDVRARSCPQGSTVLYGPLPGSAGPAYGNILKAILAVPEVSISQRGGQLWLTWKTRAVVGDNYDGPDGAGFYLDALWKFSP